VKNPKYINCLRDKIEAVIKWNNMTFDDLTYESKLNLALRLMIDRGIVSFSINGSFIKKGWNVLA